MAGASSSTLSLASVRGGTGEEHLPGLSKAIYAYRPYYKDQLHVETLLNFLKELHLLVRESHKLYGEGTLTVWIGGHDIPYEFGGSGLASGRPTVAVISERVTPRLNALCAQAKDIFKEAGRIEFVLYKDASANPLAPPIKVSITVPFAAEPVSATDEGRVPALTAKLQAAEAELARMYVDVASGSLTASVVKEYEDRLRQEQEQKQAEKRELVAKQVAKLQEKDQALRKAIEDLRIAREEHGRATEQVGALRAEVRALKAQLAEVKKEKEALEAKITELTAKLESNLLAMTKAKAESQEASKKDRALIHELQAELIKKQAKLEEAQAQLAAQMEKATATATSMAKALEPVAVKPLGALTARMLFAPMGPGLPHPLVTDCGTKMAELISIFNDRFAILPEQVFFHGSVVESVRTGISLHSDIDMKVFADAAQIKHLQVEAIKSGFMVEDRGGFIFIRGELAGVAVDMQVFQMDHLLKISAAAEATRWNSHLNVCAPYMSCQQNEAGFVDFKYHNVPFSMGPDGRPVVGFVDSKGTPIFVNDLMELYTPLRYKGSQDFTAKDLFFFLKKWNSLRVNFNVLPLAIVLKQTLLNPVHRDIIHRVYTYRDATGETKGAKLLQAFCGVPEYRPSLKVEEVLVGLEARRTHGASVGAAPVYPVGPLAIGAGLGIPGGFASSSSSPGVYTHTM